MSDDEPKDEPTDNSEQQADEQATDSDQAAGQAEEQPADSDQPAEQTEEQPSDSDQAAEQSVEQPAESDQPAEQAEEQPAEKTAQPARQADDSTGGGGGGGGSGGGVGGGGPADDAVAAGTGGKLQVKAEFTQDGGPEFAGEISIDVFDYDEKGVTKAFGPGRGVLRETRKEGNKITTPFIPVTTSRVAIQANARISIIDSASGDLRVSQVIGKAFVFRMPIPNNMLVAGFDVEVKPLGNQYQSIPAPNAEEALKLVNNMLRGSTLLFQKVEKIGDQRFRVTGKYYSGQISITHSNVEPVGKIDL